MYVSGQNADLPRIESDIFFRNNPGEGSEVPQQRTDFFGKWIPANPRLFKYEKKDILYVLVIIGAAIFFSLGR